MALLNKFEATSIYNGNVLLFTRISQTRFRKEWTEATTKDNPLACDYDVRIEYVTEGMIQKWLLDGHLVLTNPSTQETEFKFPELPPTFFFTTLSGIRYTGYIQDDVVTVAWGEGIRTQTTIYPRTEAEMYIGTGHWKILPESYRNPNQVASEFMQWMENHNGPLTTEDRVAIAQTIVLLNKVMYG